MAAKIWMTPKEAQHFLGITYLHCVHLLKTGALKGKKDERFNRWLVDPMSVANYKRSGSEKAIMRKLMAATPDGITIREFRQAVEDCRSGKTTVEKQIASWKRRFPEQYKKSKKSA